MDSTLSLASYTCGIYLSDRRAVAGLYEGIGYLLHRQLVDIQLVSELLPTTIAWKEMKPILEGTRQQYNMPELGEWFEYLYNETRKYYQQQLSGFCGFSKWLCQQ